MREFETGATRDSDEGKLDYDGFLSPLVLRRQAEYMHKHRIQADGKMRASDNWQKGIPSDVYRKSAWRHFMDWWGALRGWWPNIDVEDSACAILFNVSGWLHERLAKKADGVAALANAPSRRVAGLSEGPGFFAPSAAAMYGGWCAR